METKNITAEEVVQGCVQDLEGMVIPVGMIEQIGLPLARVVHNLKVCIEAWHREDEAKNQEEPEIVLEPVEEAEANAD